MLRPGELPTNMNLAGPLGGRARRPTRSSHLHAQNLTIERKNSAAFGPDAAVPAPGWMPGLADGLGPSPSRL